MQICQDCVGKWQKKFYSLDTRNDVDDDDDDDDDETDVRWSDPRGGGRSPQNPPTPMMPTSPPVYPTPPWRGQPHTSRRTVTTRTSTSTTTTTTTTLPPSKLIFFGY